MLEPLYLPDDFFASIILKFFMSLVVEVLGVWRPRERKKFYILYFSELNKTPSVQFVV